MTAKILEYREGFPVEKSVYYEEYSKEEIKKKNQQELEEQLEIEKRRYHAIQEQIDTRRSSIEFYQGRPEDSGKNLDASEIARLEKERDLRAENIVKICSRLGIDRIDLRPEAINEDIFKKAV
ncbi:MAG: hypothetical protein UX02_C0002G0066 [Candidatus Moranbacteria bacterium GW2011_GWC1_45_18]|nr:MAG: hypothetical protein UT79_C0001G0395 [Candidatus Moranbacteria bacterium GW2011_GWC2_40_12]KKT32367.1 MAG: hypothetical protein UW19_C0023G0021 [Candidatus Moranbacteria bacterium GW2011_GWF2_44_10]KKT99747.1 MAG: hypothetical protein UX02_C0002G0066 [Candidatus Moranbacteria bacterium GW2011_GWC1_45_18]OGI23669.1 MAG: hypothetical protein A2194_03220 [Candidatus Moranbacteria bacterium RIFOXYA1_FULL_44_8]OGI35292.1 MAG: hypothetical protein A2407_01525 [Candidatus Moranbacteria bacteri